MTSCPRVPPLVKPRRGLLRPFVMPARQFVRPARSSCRRASSSCRRVRHAGPFAGAAPGPPPNGALHAGNEKSGPLLRQNTVRARSFRKKARFPRPWPTMRYWGTPPGCSTYLAHYTPDAQNHGFGRAFRQSRKARIAGRRMADCGLRIAGCRPRKPTARAVVPGQPRPMPGPCPARGGRVLRDGAPPVFRGTAHILAKFARRPLFPRRISAHFMGMPVYRAHGIFR